jgi:hypothetical protein
MDYVFPEDDAQAKSLGRMLEMAKMWKEKGGGV